MDFIKYIFVNTICVYNLHCIIQLYAYMGSLYLLLYIILYCYIFILYGEFKRRMRITLRFNLTLPKKRKIKKNVTTKLHTLMDPNTTQNVYFKASVSMFCENPNKRRLGYDLCLDLQVDLVQINV